MKKSLLFLALCALSCSVKEERTDCPCVLTLFTDRTASWEVRVPESPTAIAERVDYPVALKVAVGGSLAWQDDGAFGGEADSEEAKVGKGLATVACHSRVERAVEEGGRLIAPTGSQWDRLYLGRCVVDCSGETASDTIDFHKEYCALWLRVEKLPVEGTASYSLGVEGDVVGMDPMTSELVAGDFSCVPDEVSTGLYRAILPRQGSGSLLSLVLSFNDIGEERRIPLWTEIRSSGFDWDAPDLADIFLTVNLSDAETSVKVVDWTTSSLDISL